MKRGRRGDRGRERERERSAGETFYPLNLLLRNEFLMHLFIFVGEKRTKYFNVVSSKTIWSTDIYPTNIWPRDAGNPKTF
jgi:hypothetical protein